MTTIGRWAGRGALAGALAAILTGCRQHPRAEVALSSAETHAAAVVSADSLPALIGALRSLKGTYKHGKSGQWVFDGDRSLFAAIAAFGDSSVARLAACLDDSSPSAATLDGRPVPVGVVCYEALLYTADAEPEGSDSGEWPGIVLPTATLEQLGAAKTAWEHVIGAHAYRLN